MSPIALWFCLYQLRSIASVYHRSIGPWCQQHELWYELKGSSQMDQKPRSSLQLPYSYQSSLLWIIKSQDRSLFFPQSISCFPIEFEFHWIINLEHSLEWWDYQSYILMIVNFGNWTIFRNRVINFQRPNNLFLVFFSQWIDFDLAIFWR